MESIEIDVILSTYNPEITYLEKLLKSISNQRVVTEKFNIHINLYWRDDFSFNYDKINSTVKKSKIYLKYIEKGGSRLGFLESYNKLFSKTENECVFICDQDDIWHPSKILSFIQTYLGSKIDNSLPIAVYSEANCIDDAGNLILKNFNCHYGYDENLPLTQFFIRNFVPGCTMMINSTLKKLYLKAENHIQLHDHTMLHIAIIFGKLVRIEEPLTLYRLHDENTLGFLQRTMLSKLANIYHLLRFYLRRPKYWKKQYPNHLKQIQYFYENFENSRSKYHKESYVVFRDFFLDESIRSTQREVFATGMDKIQKFVYKRLQGL